MHSQVHLTISDLLRLSVKHKSIVIISDLFCGKRIFQQTVSSANYSSSTIPIRALTTLHLSRYSHLTRNRGLTTCHQPSQSHQRAVNVDRHQVSLSMRSTIVLRCHFNVLRSCNRRCAHGRPIDKGKHRRGKSLVRFEINVRTSSTFFCPSVKVPSRVLHSVTLIDTSVPVSPLVYGIPKLPSQSREYDATGNNGNGISDTCMFIHNSLYTSFEVFATKKANCK